VLLLDEATRANLELEQTLTGGKRKYHCGGAFWGYQEIDVVETEKHEHCAESSALVAINKRMVSGNAEGIRGRQGGKAGNLVHGNPSC